MRTTLSKPRNARTHKKSRWGGGERGATRPDKTRRKRRRHGCHKSRLFASLCGLSRNQCHPSTGGTHTHTIRRWLGKDAHTHTSADSPSSTREDGAPEHTYLPKTTVLRARRQSTAQADGNGWATMSGRNASGGSGCEEPDHAEKNGQTKHIHQTSDAPCPVGAPHQKKKSSKHVHTSRRRGSSLLCDPGWVV